MDHVGWPKIQELSTGCNSNTPHNTKPIYNFRGNSLSNSMVLYIRLEDPNYQFLFVFEWTDAQEHKQQFMTWMVLPQGSETAHTCLDRSWKGCTAPTEALGRTCVIQTLNFLDQRRYKVSKNQAHILQQRIEHLGLVITPAKNAVFRKNIGYPEYSKVHSPKTAMGLSRTNGILQTQDVEEKPQPFMRPYKKAVSRKHLIYNG